MKTLFITGATGGLGQALCSSFSKDPCQFGLHTYQQQSEGKQLLERLKAARCEADLFSADFRDEQAIKTMLHRFLEKWGKIDLLINNTGTLNDRLLLRIDSKDWDDMISTNLSGPFYCMQTVAQAMQKNKGGHIINIGSYAGTTGRIGQASYSASKQGLIALTQSAAKEWGKDNIQVNVVCPGYLSTSMTADLKKTETDKLIRENQLHRPSSLEEVAEFIRHLSKMKHVSGQIFNLDSRIG